MRQAARGAGLWAATCAACLMLLAAAPGAAAQAEPDCTGPAPNPAPGTPEWDKREDDNVYCASQRNEDTGSNPAYEAALAQPRPPQRSGAMDPFREPTRWHGSRFRFDEVSFRDAAGETVSGMLFRPCDGSCQGLPPGLSAYEPRYPGVVIMHGGAANQEMYLWGAEGLAEAGYMVLTFSIGRGDDTHYEDTKAALEFMTSTPSEPAPGGLVNPHWAELDRERLGLAGHSAGGVAVSRLGQEDPRIDAIVSWDRAQSTTMPADLRLRTPALFVVADFNCQRVPVCLPERRSSPPDPRGPGNKDEDFQRLSAAGVDTMKIALRAATHLDFTEFPQANGSRYGVVTTFYFTRAWFDRYLLGGRQDGRAALGRLVATRFDDSADVHNISGGRYDPATASNVPAQVAGQPGADRLSFHFRSAYHLEGGRYRCESMRDGCAVPGALGPVTGACANLRAGSASRDTLRGTRFGDRLVGRRGRDRLLGHAGRDCLSGGRGRDRLSGGAGRDVLRGGKGRNAFSGGKGRDRLFTRNGRRDRVRCGGGRDRVKADREDKLRGCERVRRR